ncbi:MAG: hypothetical protein JKY61_12305 [Planctomycetes bacterium]|nr:hypothetical protein [Planctomycetota bacterium]
MGGNTIVNLFRGNGVHYKEILEDVVSKVGASAPSSARVRDRECAVAQHVITQALDKMDAAERAALESELRDISNGQANLESLRSLKNLSGPILGVIARTIAVQMMKRMGVAAAGSFAGGRTVAALAGPIGWAIGGILTAIDVTGPAYSVTVPSVVIIFIMRTEQAAADFADQVKDL